MRRFLIAGNWKMNCGPADAAELLEGLKKKKAEVSEDVDVLVCPPFVSLSMSVNYLHDTDIQVGAQNLHFEESGAYTGEVSASMLTEAGCGYVLIGHSERREYFGETDESVNKKTHKAISHKMCIRDRPCSGSGTWSRTPEQLFYFDESKIRYYGELQRKIISNALPHLKAGGYLAYITCSVFRQENETNIEFFKNELSLEEMKTKVIKGYAQKADSMFVSVLKKN